MSRERNDQSQRQPKREAPEAQTWCGRIVSRLVSKSNPRRKLMSAGRKIVIQALIDQGVDTIFGYPGGAVLPVYDALFKQNRHHARSCAAGRRARYTPHAEGYARSTGKVGVVLVTSGPGATNAVTGLMDALMDSIPIVCLTGQVPTHLIGNDAFQEADTYTDITRPCTKHNYLVKDVNRVSHRYARSVSYRALGASRSGSRRFAEGCAIRRRNLQAGSGGEAFSYQPQMKPRSRARSKKRSR